MASNRHLGRIVALQTLYEIDFRIEVAEKNVDIAGVIERNISRYSEIVDDKAFIDALIRGVLKSEKELDTFLQPLAPDWPLNQIARIDRTVLRMAVWEMKHSVMDVPIKVIINEAVELAKSFGADNSSKFVNGVLGTAAKKLDLVNTTKALHKSKPSSKHSKAGTASKGTVRKTTTGHSSQKSEPKKADSKKSGAKK